MKPKIQNKKDRHRRRNILFGAAALLVLLAGAALTLLVHRPDGYRPTAPENPEIVSPYLTHRLGPDFYNQVQLDEPFELIVTEAGLNDIIARNPWPLYFDKLSVSTPTVQFDKGRVWAMAQVDYKGLSSVVTVLAMPFMTEDGRLNLNIRSVRLGALPVTRLARSIAEKAAEQYLPAGSQLDEPTRRAVEAALNNEPFDPVLTIGDYTVRLEALDVADGQARLRLAPVEEPAR